jgi:hypothetical protein
MLALALRALVLIVAAFNIFMGALFALRPEQIAGEFFLTPSDPQGIATPRADFTAFLLICGAFAAYGAIRGQPAPLRTPIALFAVALAMRGLDIALRGGGPMAFSPMVIEATMIAILALANWSFSRPRPNA